VGVEGGAAAGEANVALTENEPRFEVVMPDSVNEMVSLALLELNPDRAPRGWKLPTR
jgi:hypothetical protein